MQNDNPFVQQSRRLCNALYNSHIAFTMNYCSSDISHVNHYSTSLIVSTDDWIAISFQRCLHSPQAENVSTELTNRIKRRIYLQQTTNTVRAQ